MLYFQLSQKNVPPLYINDKAQWVSGGQEEKADTIFVERESDALL